MIFSKFSRYKGLSNSTLNSGQGDTAVLIAIKNEEKNIKANFPSFINQNLKDFQFFVVDDYSTDDSVEILNNPPFKGKVKVIRNGGESGKKQAISYAISKIDKEYLLLTDADCFVNSANWAKKMFGTFDKDISIVLGYSPYTGSSFLHKFIRFETFMTAVQYFSYYLIGLPYMGVGRNMAIRRSFFINQNGYDNHLDIQSGNDDLFVSENANKRNTAIQINPETFVYTTPAESLSEFINQKTRHISTSFRYKTIHKLLLGFYSLSHIGFYIALILSLIYLPVYIGLTFWAFRILVLYFSAYNSFVKLKEQDLLIFLPILDFLMFIYYTYLGIYYFFAPKNKW